MKNKMPCMCCLEKRILSEDGNCRDCQRKEDELSEWLAVECEKVKRRRKNSPPSEAEQFAEIIKTLLPKEA